MNDAAGEAIVADGVRVETDGLHKFSDQVQNDTTSTLENGYSRASVDLSTGVEFGASNASGAVHAAKQRYVQSLQESTANVVAYLEAARVLATAAGKVAKALDDTDGRAARRASEVRALLDQAVVEVRQRQADAGGEA
ncbi:hypothetical protein [Paractinoplanes durhamensis]|uniref:ESX-1 secretion-associated protein n=1 Tax=Paractinoplanes durhamensis TaxID=113563 RepID=A0ABQ3YP92_9ACTN|nr:hypothetical protein [Actinoplanes durhamensis]GID99376.1 hypothetical protein Adu01nite_07270 [Actinoplanes durhamensis]